MHILYYLVWVTAKTKNSLYEKITKISNSIKCMHSKYQQDLIYKPFKSQTGILSLKYKLINICIYQ